MLGRSKAVLGDAPAPSRPTARRAASPPTTRAPSAGLAEALTTAQGGMVTPEAKTLFEKLQAEVETGEDPRPGYYLGLGRLPGRRRPEAALDLWREAAGQDARRRALAAAA